jgi:hypothetical protein
MSIIEAVLASYGLVKPPQLRGGTTRISCAPDDRLRLERAARARSEAEVDAQMHSSLEWAEQRVIWGRQARNQGLKGIDADEYVARQEKLARSKAIDADVKKRMPAEVEEVCEQLADRDAVTPIVRMTKQELLFLQLHASVLRAGTVDRSRAGLKAMITVYKNLSILIKALMFAVIAFVCMILFPGMAWMGYKVITSKMAMAKLIMLFVFMLMLIALAVVLKP